MHEYGEEFYTFLSSFAIRSAERIVPIVSAALKIESVADFGCGQGAWLSVWKKTGAEIAGLDGPYVDRKNLLIPNETFIAADLTGPIDMQRRFDLAQSVEVAEHLPSAHAEAFIDTLTAHADAVLFSAAVPGQGGEHHVNEQCLEYWREKFHVRGYESIDLVRPAVQNDVTVQRWYRCNTILYVKSTALDRLSAHARACLVPWGVPLANYWPARERVKQAVLRHLPVSAIDWMARLNTVLLIRGHRSAKV
jgi:SAM-dependent methyltransferase